LYKVETRVLNQAVKRNSRRFLEDFMFQISWEEIETRMGKELADIREVLRWMAKKTPPTLYH